MLLPDPDKTDSRQQHSMSQVFIGSLTRTTPYFAHATGRGITLCDFDDATGVLTPLRSFGDVENPGWLLCDPRQETLFALSEVFEWPEGRVTALRRNGQERLQKFADIAAGGSITAHASLDRGGRWLLVANYRLPSPLRKREAGVAVFPIAADGALGAPTALLSHDHLPLGPNAGRQECPHLHCVIPSLDNRFLLVADLGTDRVASYRFDAETGQLDSAPAGSAIMRAGAGPRHLALHPDGKRLFCINELDSTLASLAFDTQSGDLALGDVVPALPEGFAGESNAAALALTPDGRFLYASNRGHESIAIFAVLPHGLEARGHVACGGATPRSITIDPSGRYALCANQNADNVTVFAIEPTTGELRAVSRLAIGTPMCTVFGR
jgi:6-phosphogluconolactonase